MKKIPASIKRLFWDVNKESVDIEEHCSYIISRIIDYGNSPDVTWMKRTYSDEKIKEVVCKRRGLSKKSGYFWAAYYKIPKGEIKCIQRSYLKEPSLF